MSENESNLEEYNECDYSDFSVDEMDTKLWGNKYRNQNNSLEANKVNHSINLDKILYKQEIQVSKVYIGALKGVGIFDEEEIKKIYDAYEIIIQEWQSNKFIIEESDEDIFTAHERRLKEIVGPIADKISTGRSRDDMSSTILRLWLKEQIKVIIQLYKKTILQILKRANENTDVIMPGYTHLKRSEPIRFSQFLLSYAFRFQADVQRLEEVYKRVNQLALGGGGLAGTTYKIDLNKIKQELNFDSIITNSINAVSDRTFVVEFLFWASMTCLNFSQLADQLLTYNTNEFSLIAMHEVHTNGSSYYPHHDRADCLEALRGKAGTIFGKLTGFMMTIKGLHNSPSKDLNEDRQALFDTVDAVKNCIPLIGNIVRIVTIDAYTMTERLNEQVLTVEAVDYLISKGVPFRQAHFIIGQIFTKVEPRKSIFTLPLSVLKQFNQVFDDDFKLLNSKFEEAVDKRNNIGGTSLDSVNNQITQLKEWLQPKGDEWDSE